MPQITHVDPHIVTDDDPEQDAIDHAQGEGLVIAADGEFWDPSDPDFPGYE